MNTYGPLFDNLSGALVTEADARESESSLPALDSCSLGSAQTISGQQLKEKGIREVSEHNENWMEKVIEDIIPWVEWRGERNKDFTGEDIRLVSYHQPKHPNAWGALINTLIKRKIIVPTGEHRKMRDSRSHARSTPVYKAK